MKTNALLQASFIALFLSFGCVEEAGKAYAQADLELSKMVGLDTLSSENTGNQPQDAYNYSQSSANYDPNEMPPPAPDNADPGNLNAPLLQQDAKEAQPGYAWTAWHNRDDPGGAGDYEILSGFTDICAHPIDLECVTVDGNIDYTQTGDEYHCSLASGGYCVNSENPRGCQDYQVRFLCPEIS